MRKVRFNTDTTRNINFHNNTLTIGADGIDVVGDGSARIKFDRGTGGALAFLNLAADQTWTAASTFNNMQSFGTLLDTNGFVLTLEDVIWEFHNNTNATSPISADSIFSIRDGAQLRVVAQSGATVITVQSLAYNDVWLAPGTYTDSELWLNSGSNSVQVLSIPSVVPEPGTFSLCIGLVVGGAGWFSIRSRRRSNA